MKVNTFMYVGEILANFSDCLGGGFDKIKAPFGALLFDYFGGQGFFVNFRY